MNVDLYVGPWRKIDYFGTESWIRSRFIFSRHQVWNSKCDDKCYWYNSLSLDTDGKHCAIFNSAEEAMNAWDKLAVKRGFVLCSQDRFDRLKLLL